MHASQRVEKDTLSVPSARHERERLHRVGHHAETRPSHADSSVCLASFTTADVVLATTLRASHQAVGRGLYTLCPLPKEKTPTFAPKQVSFFLVFKNWPQTRVLKGFWAFAVAGAFNWSGDFDIFQLLALNVFAVDFPLFVRSTVLKVGSTLLTTLSAPPRACGFLAVARSSLLPARGSGQKQLANAQRKRPKPTSAACLMSCA